MPKRAQEEGVVAESRLLLSGFDAIISPSEDIPDAYHVVLEEGGAQVYETDIPVNLDEFEGDNEDLDGSDALLEEVGKAAIDLFEAERGTLGQGAGATDMEARTKRASKEKDIIDLINDDPDDVLKDPVNEIISDEWGDFYSPKNAGEGIKWVVEEYLETFSPEELMSMWGLSIETLNSINWSQIAEYFFNEYEKNVDPFEETSEYHPHLHNMGPEFQEDYPELPEPWIKEQRTKRAYCESTYWEEWYYNLKGTQYEDEATNLLDQYLRTWEPDQYQSDFAEDLYIKLDEIYHQMDMLNFERMKTSEPEQIFVLVQGATKKAFYDYAYVEEYLDKFRNHRLEPKAVELVKQMLDVETQIDNQSNVSDEKWKQREDLMNAMRELSMVALQSDLEARTPEIESPIEVAPNMAADIAELMSDVELEEPLEPLEEDEFQTFANKKAQEDHQMNAEEVWREVFMNNLDNFYEAFEAYKEEPEYIEDALQVIAENAAGILYEVDWSYVADMFENQVKKMKRSAEKEDEDKDTEEPREVEQIGEERDGLDPAEYEPQQQAFNANERVKLKVDVKVPMWGGFSRTYPAGTLGYTECNYDNVANFYLFRSDDGKIFKVRYDQLQSAKK